LKGARTLASKIKSPQALKATLKKNKFKKIVFTNGCFDLLHKGHVTYLERAHKLGDGLIVAVNSDASVKRLKGSDRPLNTLSDRLEVLAALESVDFVTWFEEDTPLKLITFLEPKVLVKGGDWKPAQIVGSKEVLARGGTVKSLPYIQGKSTTELIKKAQASRKR
jgi:rfaE bifunctional protein nucleotidyltransferase chain/domain